MRLKIFLFCAFLASMILFANISFATAAFSAGTPNYSIDDVYIPSQNITGWINISFNDEPADSIFKDSWNRNTITLVDLLMLDEESYSFSCNPSDCFADGAVVNAGFQRIYLDDAGFSIPNTPGDYIFGLNFNEERIFSEEIEMLEDSIIILSVSPRSTATSYPNEFVVEVESSSTIVGYTWDFGDNTTIRTTYSNIATHTYASIGTYNLTITVEDIRDLSATKTFTINVLSPKNTVNSMISQIKYDINNLEDQINNFEPFIQGSINSYLMLENISSEVESLEEDFVAAQSLDEEGAEEEYNRILIDLLELNVPLSIAESRKTSQPLPFLPSKSDINLNALSSISGENYESSRESDYIDAIVLWNFENLDIKLDFTEFSVIYRTNSEPFLRVFNFDVHDKQGIGSYFFILPMLENIEFEEPTLMRESSNFVYMDLTGSKNILFSTTGNVDFTNIPVFFTPGISKLVLKEGVPEAGTGPLSKSKLLLLLLALFLLVVISIVVYVVLQEWYRQKYENYLFKNKSDLYNMVTYVNNAKRRGLTNKEIEANLKKAKWNSEQIAYVMKKYAGKRTGMIELPLGGWIKKMHKGKPQHSPQHPPKGHPPKGHPPGKHHTPSGHQSPSKK